MSLHVHSEFSSLDGWSKVDEIADRMIEIGCAYCGLTDHGVVSGHIEFDKAMRSRNLNPVFGVELYHGIDFENPGKKRDQAHLIALAMTDEGLRNLWRLVNITSHKEKFHYVGRVSNEDIIKYKEGIIFTSACPLGLVPKGLLEDDTTYLNWYLENLGDNFRVELTTYPGDANWSDMDADSGVTITPQIINELLVSAANERGVPLTYGDDGHYARPDQFEEHDMYLAMQVGQSIYTPLEERKMYHPPNAVCIKDEEMVREALHYLPQQTVTEILNNTHDIGIKAEAHLPDAGKPHMPVFIPDDSPWVDRQGESATDLFIDLVESGIQEKYGDDKAAWERAVREMEVLINDGLVDYFLMAWDVMQFCDEEGINRGPGRGSSAGSIVAYALGITDVDPLHYDLYFERFWNQGRTDGFPDIDSDFARSRRPDIRKYLIERWGENRVCSIGTAVHMKPVATVDKLYKGCGISEPERIEIKNIVKETKDIEIHGTDQIGWNPEIEPGKIIYVKDEVGDQIDKWVGTDKRKAKFIEMCEHACSRNSNYGIHPSGIVVSDIDLDDFAPAYLRGGKVDGVPATMFPMKTIDKLKLLKLDILGLKTLDTLAEWQTLMKEKDVDIEWSNLDKQEFPKEMWDLLSDGYVAGLFQIETKEGKRLTEKLKPKSVEDLGILVALNNPGPMRSGVPEKFVARRDGREEVVYPHPMLESILDNTFGLFIYQEQIIRFMGALGYSLNDADAMRKILGKKQPEKLGAMYDGTEEWEGKGFRDIALEKGFTEEALLSVWKDLEGFASYSFNKSHSIAYGIIAFRGLVAKYFGPSEFYLACIRTLESQKKKDLMPQYIREARRMGIKVLPPDIRWSKTQIGVHEGDIYFGFSEVLDVAAGGKYVVELRDEVGLDLSTPEQFYTELERYNEEALLGKKEALKEGKSYPKWWKSPKQKVNIKKIDALLQAGAWDGLKFRDIALSEKQKLEEKYLGVILTDDSEEIWAANQEIIEECDDFDEAVTPWFEKEEQYDWTDEYGEEIPLDKRFIEYRLAGTITDIRPTKVRASGASMGIITIENGKNELTFACFSKPWKTHKFLWTPRNTGIYKIRHTAPKGSRGEGYFFEEGYSLS